MNKYPIKLKYKFISDNHLKVVYVILNNETRRVKIGITDSIQKRLQSLKMSSGCDISIEYTTPYIRNADRLERAAHKKFDKYRYIGEWFNINKNDAIDYIKSNLCHYTDKDVVEFNDIIQSDNLCQEECKPINDENFIPKKVNDKYIIGDEMLLDRPLSTFKRIGKGMYEDKNKYIFSIKYENRQWIMKRIG